MCCVKVTAGPGLTQPQADFIGCLMTGVLAAMPYFLEAFLKCLSGANGTGSDDQYAPGQRDRCQG